MRAALRCAYADMPGPLEKDQRGYLRLSSPIPLDWSGGTDRASYLREYNNWAMHELRNPRRRCPGIFCSSPHSNLYKSRLRAVLASGPMVEGWACYGQDLMADEGFLNRDPRYLLAHYKFQMRMPVNAILDQDFHVGGT